MSGIGGIGATTATLVVPGTERAVSIASVLCDDSMSALELSFELTA